MKLIRLFFTLCLVAMFWFSPVCQAAGPLEYRSATSEKSATQHDADIGVFAIYAGINPLFRQCTEADIDSAKRSQSVNNTIESGSLGDRFGGGLSLGANKT